MINLLNIAHAVTISASIPGAYDTSNAATASPGQFIADFYQYALVIGGILAFGVIVYGGIRYMTSAGNPSGQGDAKEWIQAAIMGILLLAGAYFILKVINPNLVNLTLPTLDSVGQTNTSGGTGSSATGTSGGGVATTTGSQPTASTCQATSNGGSTGSCPSVNNVAQNCCNINGAATCQSSACASAVNCGDNNQNGYCSNTGSNRTTVRHCCLYVEQWECQVNSCSQ